MDELELINDIDEISEDTLKNLTENGGNDNE